MQPQSPRRKKLAVLFLLVFAGAGFWFFGGRLPAEVSLRLELPPSVQTPSGRLQRADMGHLTGVVTDDEGAVVGRFSFAQRWQGDAPLSRPIALRLRRGAYRVAVEVDRDADRRRLRPLLPEGSTPDLVGTFEVGGPGEVRVDVRAPR